jgi:hypothetical protein
MGGADDRRILSGTIIPDVLGEPLYPVFSSDLVIRVLFVYRINKKALTKKLTAIANLGGSIIFDDRFLHFYEEFPAQPQTLQPPTNHPAKNDPRKKPDAGIKEAKKFAEQIGYRWQENTNNPDLAYDLFFFN